MFQLELEVHSIMTADVEMQVPELLFVFLGGGTEISYSVNNAHSVRKMPHFCHNCKRVAVARTDAVLPELTCYGGEDCPPTLSPQQTSLPMAGSATGAPPLAGGSLSSSASIAQAW